MSTTELRKRVIARLKASKDVKVLREIDRLLKGVEQEVAPYLTTEDQRKSISKSRAALKKGRVRTSGQVDKAVGEWLGK